MVIVPYGADAAACSRRRGWATASLADRSPPAPGLVLDHHAGAELSCNVWPVMRWSDHFGIAAGRRRHDDLDRRAAALAARRAERSVQSRAQPDEAPLPHHIPTCSASGGGR